MKKAVTSKDHPITLPFTAAAATLGVAPDADERTVKKAYRALVAQHPPDRDPEAFRRIRDAYELLVDPFTAAQQQLRAPEPHIPPPAPKVEAPPAQGAVALSALRRYAAQLDVEALLGGDAG